MPGQAAARIAVPAGGPGQAARFAGRVRRCREESWLCLWFIGRCGRVRRWRLRAVAGWQGLGGDSGCGNGPAGSCFRRTLTCSGVRANSPGGGRMGGGVGRLVAKVQVSEVGRCSGVLKFCSILAPPAGFEPAHTAPEAVALSPELWGLRELRLLRRGPQGRCKATSPDVYRTRRRSARMAIAKQVASRG